MLNAYTILIPSHSMNDKTQPLVTEILLTPLPRNCGKGTLHQSHFHTSKTDNIKALLEACYHKRGETYCKIIKNPKA